MYQPVAPNDRHLRQDCLRCFELSGTCRNGPNPSAEAFSLSISSLATFYNIRIRQRRVTL
jgi:hypothetical protein